MKGSAFALVIFASACTDATGALTLDPAEFTITIGNRRHLDVRLGAGLLPPDPGTGFTWTSSDTAVVFVSREGDVLALKGGVATVSASTNGRVGVANVRVVPGTSGVWLAQAADTFYTFVLSEITAGNESSASVSGSVSVLDSRDSLVHLNIQGSRTYPGVALHISRNGQPDATLAGTFTSDTTIASTVTGFGPQPRALALSRPTCYCPWLFPAPGATATKSGASCGAPVLCAPSGGGAAPPPKAPDVATLTGVTRPYSTGRKE